MRTYKTQERSSSQKNLFAVNVLQWQLEQVYKIAPNTARTSSSLNVGSAARYRSGSAGGQHIFANRVMTGKIGEIM